MTSALAKAPYWAKVLGESGWELSCASSRWIDYMHIAPDVEDKHIREAIASLQQIRGDKSAPMGECDETTCRDAMRIAYCDRMR